MGRLEDVYKTLCNEYTSGTFTLEGDSVEWTYSTAGLGGSEEAEDRWLSFLGAKITARNVTEGTDFEIVENFERKHKIGFSVRKKPTPDARRRF
jgi:hypothetical protein